MGIGRKQFRAHRVSYAVFKGEDLGEKLVLHRCDTPLCINPEHLFLGNPLDNTADMIAKGRQVIRSAEKHHNFKVSYNQRDEIREMWRLGFSLKAIAKKYGVSFKTINGICLKRGSYAAR